MLRKILAAFTILAFMGVSTACTTWTTRGVQDERDYPSPGRKVASVVKANGDVVDFEGPELGRVLIDKVEGRAMVLSEETVELKGPFSLVRKRRDGSVSEVTDASGRVHYVVSVVKEGPDRMTILEHHSEMQRVSIPLSEVRLIKYRTTNALLTLAAALGVVAVGLAVATAIAFKGWLD